MFIKGIYKFRRIRKDRVNSAGDLRETIDESVCKPSPIDMEQRDGRSPTQHRDKIKIDLLIHDLKVPLAVIEAGISSLLNRQEKYGPVTEQQERVFRRALRNTKIVQRLVNDTLELGRAREGIVDFSNFKVSNLIEQTLVEIFDLTDAKASEEINECAQLTDLEEALEKRGVSLFVDKEFWGEEVCMDEAKVKQILRNLLNNALKYRKNRIELKVERTPSYVVLSVKDDGEGIPAAYHKKIFECYFQLDPEDTCSVRGHGLGLAGVMVLVEDLGGKLFLDSDSGLGTRFLVKIPYNTKK